MPVTGGSNRLPEDDQPKKREQRNDKRSPSRGGQSRGDKAGRSPSIAFNKAGSAKVNAPKYKAVHTVESGETLITPMT